MKTSNILLIGLLVVTLLFGMGSNLVLKGEFEKINKNDLYSGYRKESLKPFKYVTLGGKPFGYAQIQPGQNFEIRTKANPKILDWKIEKDTLKLNYKKDWKDDGYSPPDPFWGPPVIYILAPEISMIESNNVRTKVSGWDNQDLVVRQKGERMRMINNKIANLSVQINSQGHVEIDQKNDIGTANVFVKDSSNFSTENVFKSFNIQVDSAARVSLPGNLLKKAGIQ